MKGCRTMAWARRGKRFFYYRSTRSGKRVSHQYFGNGPNAQKAASEDKRRREARNAERRLTETRQQEYARCVTPLLHLCRLTDALLKATLAAHGYQQHKR